MLWYGCGLWLDMGLDMGLNMGLYRYTPRGNWVDLWRSAFNQPDKRIAMCLAAFGVCSGSVSPRFSPSAAQASAENVCAAFRLSAQCSCLIGVLVNSPEHTRFKDAAPRPCSLGFLCMALHGTAWQARWCACYKDGSQAACCCHCMSLRFAVCRSRPFAVAFYHDAVRVNLWRCLLVQP